MTLQPYRPTRLLCVSGNNLDQQQKGTEMKETTSKTWYSRKQQQSDGDAYNNIEETVPIEERYKHRLMKIINQWLHFIGGLIHPFKAINWQPTADRHDQRGCDHGNDQQPYRLLSGLTCSKNQNSYTDRYVGEQVNESPERYFHVSWVFFLKSSNASWSWPNAALPIL